MFQVAPEFLDNRSLRGPKNGTASAPAQSDGTAPSLISNQTRIRNAQRRDARTDVTEAAQTQSNQIRNASRSAFIASDSVPGTDTREPYRTTSDRTGADPSRPTVSDSFNEQYSQQGIRNVSRESAANQEVTGTINPNQATVTRTRQAQSVQQRTLEQSKSTAAASTILSEKRKLKAAKVLIKGINAGLGTPLFMYWISIQVPLALFGLILIALSSAAQAAIESSWILRTVAAVIGSVASTLSGVEVNQSMLHGPGLGVMMILFLIGLAIFIGLVFAYLLLGMKMGVRPIFGKGFLLKIGALLCVAFYIVPLINLLPLHIPYMLVMRYYPK